MSGTEKKERDPSGIGMFELLACCLATCVLSVTASYFLMVSEMKPIAKKLPSYKPLVLDFQGLTNAYFNKVKQESEGLPLELARNKAGQEGEKLGKMLRELTDQGYLLLDSKRAVIAAPAQLDVTKQLADQLGVRVAER